MENDYEVVVVSSQQSLSPLQGSQASQVTVCSLATPPPTSTNIRRKRTPRATSNQIETLLAHIEARPFLITRRFVGLQSRENYDSAWREVVADLNGIGSFKTVEQWITVWRDLKSRACTKAAKLKREIHQTGNRGIDTPQLTDTEKRIISIVGADYSIGTNCPDSMPEEDTAQHQLQAGVSTEITNQTEIIEEMTEDILNVETIHSASSQPQLATTATSNHRSNTPSLSQRRVNRNLNPRRSISEQHRAARNEFLAIAETNAESMRMLAAAVKMQADSAKVQAEASLLFAQATNKIADALIKFAENKNNP